MQHVNETETHRTTIELPKALLKAAQEETGESITKTVTAGLEKLARSRNYRDLRSLRGRENIEFDVEASRADRNFQ